MIEQCDRDLFIRISALTPDGETARKINLGLAFTYEVEQIAAHRLAERARIVAFLRTHPGDHARVFARAIEEGEHCPQ